MEICFNTECEDYCEDDEFHVVKNYCNRWQDVSLCKKYKKRGMFHNSDDFDKLFVFEVEVD